MNKELLEKLKDDVLNGNHYAKLSAIDRLSEIGNNSALEIIIQAFEDDDDEISFKASLYLKNCSAKLQKKIILLFSHKKWKVRSLASDVIVNSENPSINTLIEVLKKNIDTNSIFWIIKTLGRIGDAKSFSALREIIETGKEEEKIAAIEALSSIKENKSINLLIKTLVDENWHVRKKAAEALNEMGDVVVLELIKNIGTDNSDMFYWITKIIGKLKSTDAVESLIKLLDTNKDNEKREIVIKTIGYIGNDECIDYLVERLNDESWTMRKYAAEALVCSGKKILPKIIETFGNKNPDIRYWCVWIIGKIEDENSFHIFEEAIKDKKWFVRSLAVSYVGSLNIYNFITKLIPLIDDENQEVRKSVSSAIEKLKSKKSLDVLEKYILNSNGKLKSIAENIVNQIKYES